MWTNQRESDQSGVALIAAMFALVILGGLAVIFMATATFESRATGNERRFETSLHVSEAATDDIIVNVNEDLAYSTTYDGTTKHVHLEHNSNTYSDEEQWALDVASATADAFLTKSGSGEAIGIRPVDPSTGKPVDVVYGVGYMPDRDRAVAGNGRIRVLKLQIQPGVYSPSQAFLVDGDLTLGGGASTDGITGNVHANGDVFIEGSSGDCDDGGICVRGKLSMTGTLKKGPAPSGPEFTDSEQAAWDEEHVCPLADLPTPCGADDITEGAGPKDVGDFTALTFYDDYHTRLHDSDPNNDPPPLNRGVDSSTGNVVEARWWVLCPDGKIRVPDGTTKPATLCASTATPYWQQGQTANFHGWVFKSGSCSDFGSTPAASSTTKNYSCWVADKVVSGAYYVHNSNAVTNGGSGAVSVLVACSGSDPAPAADNCTSDPGGQSGSYWMKGQPKLTPAIPGIHFVADRDILLNGQAGTEVDGFIGAREQIDNAGQGDLNGSIVALNRPHTLGSPVELNAARGSFRVSYNKRLKIPIPGITQIIAWNEL